MERKKATNDPRVPLAERMRPTRLSEVVGQDAILGKGKVLTEIVRRGETANLIFWGPPGTGKTTLARILAKALKAEFIEISAVSSGKKEVEKIINQARINWRLKQRTILFVDEIHRFNKAQQDAFLPHVESGLITLIGATTENPSFEVINPLLSRSRIIVLEALNENALKKIIKRALKMEAAETKLDKDGLMAIIALSGGDARKALGILELALALWQPGQTLGREAIKRAAGKQLPIYDQKGDAHYDNISAFIKSMRGGEDEAALFYLARMLEAGEDPKFIARRMVIFASEDIGLMGNGALGLALNAFMAVERVGMPESGLILAHVTTALTRAKKSRETTEAWDKAKALAKTYSNAPVPLEIRNAPTKLMQKLGYSKGYKWEAGFKLKQQYLPKEVKEGLIFGKKKSHSPKDSGR